VLEQVPNSQVVRFGTFEVDLRLGELRKNGIRVKLTGQPFQILVILLEHPGDLVTREQLQRRLWPSDTFVDFDRGLNAAINRVREALGDSAENPRFVETLPRRGYRFIAPLVDSRPAGATLPAAESNVSPAQTVTSPRALPLSEARGRRPVSRRLKLLLGGVSVLAFLVIAVVLLSRLSRGGDDWNFQGMKLTRVTQSGGAVNVAISPDGHYVVYALREGEKQGLNVRQVATGSDVQILPPDEVMIYSLTFSPDGNYIDFIRSEKNNPTSTFLYRIPTLGGTPHLAMQGGVDFSTSYSPDGARFAFLRVMGSEQVDYSLPTLMGATNACSRRVRILTSLRMAQRGPLTAKRLSSQQWNRRKAFVRYFGQSRSAMDLSVKSIRHPTLSAVLAGCRMEVAFWRRLAATSISPFAGNSGSFLFPRDKQGVLRMIGRITNPIPWV